MSHFFEKEIERLNKHLNKLAEKVEEQVGQSIIALSNADSDLAKNIKKYDKKVDQAEIEMEEECLKLLALHQPVANDLRLIIAVLKINADLERIGDHTVIIAKEVIKLTEQNELKVPEELFELSRTAKAMLRKSLLAFVEGDLHIAKTVMVQGQQSDDLAGQVTQQQIALMKKKPEQIEQRLSLIVVTRQLQRIADHATNIAEDIIFLKSGDIIRHSKSW